MNFNIDLGLYNGVFAVPSIIVDQYLKLASEAALKVILCLLRYSGVDLDIDLIIKETGLSNSQIKDAFLFWEDLQVIKKGSSDFIIENRTYQTDGEEGFESKTSASPAPIKNTVAENDNTVNKREKTKDEQRPLLTIKTNSPKYPDQIEAAKRLKESPEIKEIISTAEVILGRTLNASALESIVMLFDWAEIQSDVLIMIIHHCKNIGINDFRRIEKTALSFKNKGIDTHEKADEYIKLKAEQHIYENKVKSIFGFSGRNLSKKEAEYIDVWYNHFNFKTDIISVSFEKCVDTIEKVSFAYINTILQNWYDQNVKTIDDIRILDEEFEASKKTTPKTNQKNKKDNSNKTYDIDEIEKSDMYRVPKL